jgi:hypothetical protein
MEMSSQFDSPAVFIPGEKSLGTHSIGGWVSLIAGLDTVEERKVSAPTMNRTPVPWLFTP